MDNKRFSLKCVLVVVIQIAVRNSYLVTPGSQKDKLDIGILSYTSIFKYQTVFESNNLSPVRGSQIIKKSLRRSRSEGLGSSLILRRLLFYTDNCHILITR